jgi:hypothetical protein
MRIFHGLAVAGFAATVTIAATMAVNAQGRNGDRVCKEVCSAGVCRQECIQTEGRGDRDRDRRDRPREERRDREPGVELRVPVPVPDIRVGPPPS